MSRDAVLRGVLPMTVGVAALVLLLAWELRYVLNRPPAPRLTVATAILVVLTVMVIAARFAAYA